MATGGNDISSDEIINIKCSFCAEDNRTREAEKYCVECRDYYCLSCATTHTKFPAMRGHKLLDKADFRSQGLDGSLPSFPTQRCTLHLSEVVSMFCRDHNEVACPSCMFLNHRSCTNIHSIAEEVDSLYNTTQLTNMKQKILTAKETMEDMKKAKESQVKQLKKAFDQEVKSVKAFRQELQTLLDSMEQESIRELKREFDRIEKCLNDEIIEANKLLGAMNTAASQLRKSEGNKVQEFISVKVAEKVASKADDVETEQKKTKENISFTADESIRTFLKQKQKFGKVTSNMIPGQQILTAGQVSSTSPGQKTLVKVSSNKQVFHSKKDGLYKVKQSRKVDIKLVNDRSECSIYGSCITEDGSVLLADHSNNNLKRFDLSTNKVKDHIQFKASPIAVCLISKTEAAVTLEKRIVKVVSLASKLTATVHSK